MAEDHLKKISEYIEMILTDMSGSMVALEQIQSELKEMEADNEQA